MKKIFKYIWICSYILFIISIHLVERSPFSIKIFASIYTVTMNIISKLFLLYPTVLNLVEPILHFYMHTVSRFARFWITRFLLERVNQGMGLLISFFKYKILYCKFFGLLPGIFSFWFFKFEFNKNIISF